MSTFSLTGGTDAVPPLYTERLVLRQISADQIAAIVGHSRLADWAPDFPAEGDLEIGRMLSKSPLATGPASVFDIRQLIERSSDLVVGGVGFFGPPTDGSVEIGYGVVPSRRGRGYAIEAVRAMIDFAFTDAEVREVRAGVDVDNVASVRVLEKAGLRCRRRTEGQAVFSTPRLADA